MSLGRLLRLAIAFFVFSILFLILEKSFPSINSQPIIRVGYQTDMFYWVLTPIFTRTISKVTFVVAGITIAKSFGITDFNTLWEGFGPLSRQPLIIQALEIILIADFIGYWIHRAFHSPRLWKFHAIHHSSEQLDWLSSVRLHPINDIIARSLQALPLILIGLSPKVIAVYLPFLTFHSIFIHSNVRFSFGPFKKILSSPTFHRWHHTKETEALDKNFAGLFPVWDILFGTYYLPANKTPSNFGTQEVVPNGVIQQLIFPFQNASDQKLSHIEVKK